MFQVGATCYHTAAAANAATGSAQSGSVVLIGGQPYVLALDSATDTAITYVYSPVSGGAGVSQTFLSNPPDCGLWTADDAVSVGWMIGAAWLAVFVVTFLTSVLRSHFAPQNDT